MGAEVREVSWKVHIGAVLEVGSGMEGVQWNRGRRLVRDHERWWDKHSMS